MREIIWRQQQSSKPVTEEDYFNDSIHASDEEDT